MADNFTWIPLYGELAQHLVGWEHLQPRLIEILEKLRADGVKVTPLTDQDVDGARYLIKEIDPFTIFATFNRGIRDAERLAILKTLKRELECAAELPTDFYGIPIVNNMSSWFIGYQAKREPDDVARLWRVFRLALQGDVLQNPEFAEAFDKALQVFGVSINLTMGLFWIRPDVFLNLDQTNRDFLGIKLPPGGLSAAFYLKTINSVRERKKPFVELSYEAWLSGQSTFAPNDVTIKSADAEYWLVGAYWDDRDPTDQTNRFLEKGIWENGYEDHYIDIVKSMKVGDRIAIKAATTQKNDLPFDARGKTVAKMVIKAVGTVVANRKDGRTVEVEWDPKFQQKDWFFFVNQKTVWRLPRDSGHQNSEYVKRLIDFIWRGKPQDFNWFSDKWWGADGKPGDSVVVEGVAKPPYGVEDMIAAGVFLSASELGEIVDRLRKKKNLILQGPPGVGKTFVARKLAHALMEEKDDTRVQFVQFHQTYAYEDFVRGYRPSSNGNGGFELRDGVFFTFCKRAAADLDQDYVFIIDEINRGNLSQIFGDLLMLIEADKRGMELIELIYRHPGESAFSVPPNLHLIGLMNLADRSLAVVDYAVRRRFAFVTLKPQLETEHYRKWVLDRGMMSGLIDLIVDRIGAVNQQIANDPLLGENYQIGHSFFCPKGDFTQLDRRWFDAIVQTEIIPLLKEYWFDNSKRAAEAAEMLTAK